jgi:hypothetical protein
MNADISRYKHNETLFSDCNHFLPKIEIFQVEILIIYSGKLSFDNVVEMHFLQRIIQKEVYTFKNVFCKYYWTYGDVLYIDWRENSQS